jgi:polyphosphate kinase
VKKNESRYFSRELSWIEFNARVLDEARQADVPLLERLKFLTIVSSNFDEFFMVRVASLKAQFARNPDLKDASGLSPREQLARLSERVHELVEIQYQCLLGDILPGLAKEGVTYIRPSSYTPGQLRFLDKFFSDDVFPLLTPLRAGSDGALPSLGNLRLHAAFLLRQSILPEEGPLADFIGEAVGSPAGDSIAIVQIPTSIPRVVWLPDEAGARRFTLIDDVVRAFGQRLFPGYSVAESSLFKVTRDADGPIDEDREGDFIDAVKEVLAARLSSMPVRLISTGESPVILSFLKERMGLEEGDIYRVSGPMDLPTLLELVGIEGVDHLRYQPWKNYPSVDFPEDGPLWDELKRRDLFLHVPYQSWEPVLRFLNDAADDPDVLAIKMTLYRTSGDSPVIRALERAARAGKHVTAFVEIKARFDEERNLAWARRLEEVVVIVVYGIARLKVHAKVLLVVRRERDGVRRYAHLSTGNYNDKTARFYSDMSLFTANAEIANDATLFFNMISGYSAVVGMKRLAMAPIELKPRLLALIDREIEKSSPEMPGLIMAKMNSLADSQMIDALYRASRAGVRVLLNVRGVCMLVPGVRGLSENVTVVSVIDRFLEHSRAFLFQNGGSEELYLSSADWMSRNLDRRVELMFPVLQESVRKTIRGILSLYFRDTVKSHRLKSDGAWARVRPARDEAPVRAQEELYLAEKRKSELAEKEPRREFNVRRN